jgi:hypothetical protein
MALLAAFGVGYAIGLALIQLWGRLAGSSRQASNEAANVDTGVISGSGAFVINYSYTRQEVGTKCADGTPWNNAITNDFAWEIGTSAPYVRDLRVQTRKVVSQGICGSGTNGPDVHCMVFSYINNANGILNSSNRHVHYDGKHYQNLYRGTGVASATIHSITRDGQTVWTPRPADSPQPISPDFNEAPDVAPVPPLLPGLPVLPTAPAADPVTVPGRPVTAPRPAALPAAPRPGLPTPAPGSQPTNNGQVVPRPELPPVTTPGDIHYPWPGGPPVGPGGARPDLVAIAQEVGRIEKKLALMPKPPADPANPIDWGDMAATLMRIWDAIQASNAGGEYTLSSPCVVDEATGDRIVTEVPYAGAFSWLEVLGNKIDALAELQQVAKDLRQPICAGHSPKGELVTVNFISPTKPPGSSAYLRKYMRYRDNSSRPEADHVAHWVPFEWQAGPAIVASKGAVWGTVQVWAADPEEGRRVIRHAAAIAGVDLAVSEHQWIDSTPRSSRYGQTGVMRVEHDRQGTPCISKRAGSAGRPEWALDL